MKKKKRLKADRLLESFVDVACPYCGKVSQIAIDEGGGEHQTFVEDCEVCCRPRVVQLDLSPESGPMPFARADRS